MLVGAAMPFAFAPYELWILAPVGLALLVGMIHGAEPRRALKMGWLFGFGMFLSGVPWVYTSMHDFGHVVGPIAALGVLLFAATMGLFPAFACWLTARLKGGVFTFASSWIIAEWVRSWFLTGFPWLSIGYSQVGGPLEDWFVVGGVFLTGWWVALISAIACTMVRRRAAIGVKPAAGLLLFLLASFGLSQKQWVEAVNEPLSVAIAQGNFGQDIKWLASHRQRQLDWYSQATFASSADLMVWPETAIPLLSHRAQSYLAQLQSWGVDRDTAIVLGLPEYQVENEAYYNTLFAMGAASGRYQKVHLVPLGEYFPFKPLLRLLPGLDIPLDDMSAGEPDQPPLVIKNELAAASICYEDAFGNQMRSTLGKASFLINASNDAWFGPVAPHQHLQMARARALELGRPMVRATNTGVSALIDHKGSITEQSEQDTQAVIRGTLQPMHGTTWYSRYGDYPSLILCALILIAVLIMGRKQPPERLSG